MENDLYNFVISSHPYVILLFSFLYFWMLIFVCFSHHFFKKGVNIYFGLSLFVFVVVACYCCCQWQSSKCLFYLLGCDIVDWLKRQYNITDVKEACYLATNLCQYGYIYPIDFKLSSYTVKYDRSAEYRFQVNRRYSWVVEIITFEKRLRTCTMILI